MLSGVPAIAKTAWGATRRTRRGDAPAATLVVGFGADRVEVVAFTAAQNLRVNYTAGAASQGMTATVYFRSV